MLARIASFSVAWAVLVLAGGALTAEPLRFGTFAAEPFMTAQADGSVGGATVEYTRAILQKMGVTGTEFRLLPFGRLLAELGEGGVDVALVLVKTPEREKQFAVAAQPLYYSRTGLVVLKDGPLKKVETVEDVRGLRIGYTGGAALGPFLKAAQIDLSLLYQIDAAESQIRMLASRRVDAVFTPSVLTMAYYVHKFGDEATMTILPLPEPPVGWYVVFTKKAGERYLRAYEEAQARQLREVPFDTFFADWLKTNAGR